MSTTPVEIDALAARVDALTAQVDAMAARAELQDLVAEYAAAADDRDEAFWRRAFAADAEARYTTNPVLVGREAIVGWLLDATAPVRWSQHLLTPRSIRVQPGQGGADDTAEVRILLLTHTVLDRSPDTVLVRGSSTQWRCRRASGGAWQITYLEQTLGYSEERRSETISAP